MSDAVNKQWYEVGTVSGDELLAAVVVKVLNTEYPNVRFEAILMDGYFNVRAQVRHDDDGSSPFIDPTTMTIFRDFLFRTWRHLHTAVEYVVANPPVVKPAKHTKDTYDVIGGVADPANEIVTTVTRLISMMDYYHNDALSHCPNELLDDVRKQLQTMDKALVSARKVADKVLHNTYRIIARM